MILPRALVGPVMAMARPGRPPAERAAVLAAAAVYPTSWAITRKATALAKLVVAELMKQIQLPNDPLLATLAELVQLSCQSPVLTLATDPEINTLDEIVERQVALLRARNGRYLTVLEQRAELASIAAEVEPLLAGRYGRHLRPA